MNPKFKVGDKVILHCHAIDGHGMIENWSPAMDQFVGLGATLTCLIEEYDDGHILWETDITSFVWREASMTLVSDSSSSGPIHVRKVYVDECPCGIHPEACEYHRQ